MNSILSYIAGLVVLVLFTALVGPSVVDWNSFRSEVEVQVSSTMGRPIRIGGDINFVILPAPRFSLQSLSVLPGDGSEPLAEIGTLEGEVALTPLLRGEIEVTRVRARDFDLTIKRDAEGRTNWGKGGAESAALDLENIRFDSVNFEGGSISFADAATGQAYLLSNVAGDLKATSLLGPLKVDGSFTYNGASLAATAAVGAFGGDRAFPVTLDLAAADDRWRASFSGLATDTSEKARLDGVTQFSLFADAEAPVDEQERAPVLALKAGTVVSRELATFREMELAVAGSTLKGEATLALGAKPVLSASLSGARLAADRLYEALGDGLLAPQNFGFPEMLSGTLDLSVSELFYGKLNGSQVNGRFALDQGILAVQSFSAEFPGGGDATLQGALQPGPQGPRFDGTLEARVVDLPELTRWIESRLTPEEDGAAPAPRAVRTGPKTLHLETQLALQPTLWQAYSLSAVFGDGTAEQPPLVGGLSLARRSKPALGIELAGPQLDLRPVERFVRPLLSDLVPDLHALDANLTVSAGRLLTTDLSLDDVGLTATLAEGRLSVERFEAANELGRVSLTGSLKDPGPTVTGGVEGSVSAPLFTAYAEDLLDLGLGTASAGDLDFTLRADKSEARHLLSLDLNGSLDGSSAALVYKRDRSIGTPSEGNLDVVLSLENENGTLLMRQIGLSGDALAGPEGEGAVRAQLSGPLDGPYTTAVRLRSGDTTFSVNGETAGGWSDPQFAGRFEASADAFENLAAVAGWDNRLVDIVAANGRHGAVIAGGQLEWSANRVAVSQLEAVAGTFRLSGAASVDRGEADPRIDASLEVGRLTLDTLLDAPEGDNWSAEALDWHALAEAEGQFSIRASAVDVAGLVFRQVSAEASLSEGVLSFTPVTADFADGRLTLGGRFEGGGDMPGIGLTLALEDAKIDEAAKLFFGAPLANGFATASMQVEGRGRSLLGLVSALQGRGTLLLSGGALGGMDLPSFRSGLDTLETMDGFEPLVAQTLLQGETSFGTIEGTVRAEDGLVRFEPDRVEIAGTEAASVTALVDLVRLEADIDTKVTLEGDQPLPPVNLVLAGPLRDLERQTDTLQLQAAVSQALLVREIEESGVEDLPDELRDLIAPTGSTPDSLDAPLEGVLPPGDGAAASVPRPMARPAP